MISSPSAQIVNALAESYTVKGVGGKGKVKAYGPVMGIATAIIAVGIICTVAVGPEKRGRKFEDAAIAGVEVMTPPEKDIEAFGEDGDIKAPKEHIEMAAK